HPQTPVASPAPPRTRRFRPPDDKRLHHQYHQMTEATSPVPPDDKRLHHQYHQMTRGYITSTTR
ncbi:hypothetical protein Hamer_G028466, partial [Homarus americanus]